MIKRNEKKSHTLSIFFTEFADLRPEALAGFEKEIKRLVEMRRSFLVLFSHIKV